MKVLFLLVFLLLSYVSFSQSEGNAFFSNQKELGGDVVLQSANISVNNENAYKTFELDCAENGAYYLNAWIMVPETPEGYPEYKIEINGTLCKYTLKPEKNNWQRIILSDTKGSPATIELKRGKNKVAVIGKCPEIPDVEFIKLSTNLDKAEISALKYNQFVSQINSQDKTSTIGSIKDTSNIRTKGTNGQAYTYALNVPVYYTTYKTFSFNAGQNLNIKTSSVNSYEHVIEVFSKTNPASYSWSAAAPSNGNLNITIPVTGEYYVRLRAFRQTTSGLVNLNINNGQYNYTNCVVSGYGKTMDGGHSNIFFTSKITGGGNTILWLEDNSSFPGKIRAYNDNYGTVDGYSWGLASRITYNGVVESGLISAASSNNPISQCDLYMGLSMGKIVDYPDNNNYIRSDGASNYNCVSWTIDRTDYREWPLDTWSSYYDSIPITAFDICYEKNGYTRLDALASNAGVAITSVNGFFKHAMITKNAWSKYPHGFDWESKDGLGLRVMHPRDALRPKYGDIAYYYRPKSSRSNNLSLQAMALDVKESAVYSTELKQLTVYKDKLQSKINSTFDLKYDAWKKSWYRNDIENPNDPRSYTLSEEYKELVAYCSSIGKAVWPLFIEKLMEGDTFVTNLLTDLTLAENKDLFDEVKNEIQKKASLRSDFPLPSIQTNALNYAVKLLKRENKNIENAIIETNKKIASVTDLNIETTMNYSNIVLNFLLEKESNIDLKIVDIYGVQVFATNKKMNFGESNISIPTNNLKNSIYIIHITDNNGRYFSKKIILNK
ncbi:MAG: T9SS type A sorting domain-containing protein [Tannerellaceae bacterium]|jgi:hypothetical protein|nr:T9SS type A sorting domain-containing protein [Tannerellaceae bacterium]